MVFSSSRLGSSCRTRCYYSPALSGRAYPLGDFQASVFRRCHDSIWLYNEHSPPAILRRSGIHMALRTVAPSELALPNAGDSPRRLRVLPERISRYASRLDLRHVGPDLEIDSFRPLSRLDEAGEEDSRPLTYLSASRFARFLEGRRGLAVVTTP